MEWFRLPSKPRQGSSELCFAMELVRIKLYSTIIELIAIFEVL